MYKIKQLPEDFIVNEIFKPNLSENGGYVYFQLKKKNYNTIDAVRTIAAALHINEKNFGFAGSKDRNAVTMQVVSARTSNNAKIRQLESLKLKDIEITILGKAEKPVSLGDHEGNEFVITIRNLESVPKIKPKFINYFGEQRFGKNNAEIGRLILKREWKKAVELIDRDDVKNYIETHPTEFIGAIRKLPRKLSSMYIHAYQSLIWNNVAKKVDCDEFSTPGFGIELLDEKADRLTKELIEADGITERDFILREMPEIHTEGRTRKRMAEAKNLEIVEEGNDELNEGKKKLVIKFSLGKGCYATEFLRQVFT